MTNNSIFGVSIPTVKTNAKPNTMAEAIALDTEYLNKLKDFYLAIIAKDTEKSLISVDANSADELDDVIAHIKNEREHANSILIAPRLFWSRRESNSYLAKYIYDTSEAVSANISSSVSDYLVLNGERKSVDLGKAASKNKCSDDFQNLLMTLDQAKALVIKSIWAVKNSLASAAEEVKLLEIAMRDSVNFDVVDEVKLAAKKPVNLRSIKELPSSNDYADLFDNYLNYMGEGKNINISCKGTPLQMVRLMVRSFKDGDIYFTGGQKSQGEYVIDRSDFVTGYDVVATSSGVKVQPIPSYATESVEIGNSVALEMLKGIKERHPSVFSGLNVEAHKFFLVHGSIDARQAMSIANMVSSEVSTIFNGFDSPRIQKSLTFYEQTASAHLRGSAGSDNHSVF